MTVGLCWVTYTLPPGLLYKYSMILEDNNTKYLFTTSLGQPGILLSSLHLWTHLILFTSKESGTIMIFVLWWENGGTERLSQLPKEPQLMSGGTGALDPGSLSPELAHMPTVMLLSWILQGRWQNLEQWCGVYHLSCVRMCPNPVFFQPWGSAEPVGMMGLRGKGGSGFHTHISQSKSVLNVTF